MEDSIKAFREYKRARDEAIKRMTLKRLEQEKERELHAGS